MEGNLLLNTSLGAKPTYSAEQQRTATVYKTGEITAAGATVVWTPAIATTKFRILSIDLLLTEEATLAVAGDEEITFTDGATTINIAASFFVPSVAVTGIGDAGQYIKTLPGNGYLSIANGNVLSINLGTALATGKLRYNLMGCEE